MNYTNLENRIGYKFKNKEISELCDKVCELIAKEK